MPFGMFDFAPVGLGILVAGLAFLVVGWRLLPGERRSRVTPDEAFRTRRSSQRIANAREDRCGS